MNMENGSEVSVQGESKTEVSHPASRAVAMLLEMPTRPRHPNTSMTNAELQGASPAPYGESHSESDLQMKTNRHKYLYISSSQEQLPNDVYNQFVMNY